MKKILTVLIILTAAASAVFAAKTYTAYTEHFDIIYSEKSLQAADSLYKNCEQIYDEVSKLLGYEGTKHIPVYIDSDNPILNAYETQWPYNRIYLRDTTDQIGNITNQEDVFLGIFRHELTHALQFEIKPGWFVKAGSAVFGDWFSLQGLQLFPSYVEGTAVMSESIDGEHGRLNSNLAMQRLKQAKIENKFPSFFQAIGMRDTYPGGEVYYLFGGAFTEYLRIKCGEDRLQQFYKSTGTIKLWNITSFKFKKAFGLKQNLAWQDFANQIEVSSNIIEANPLTKKSRFSNLKYCNGSLYVIDTTKNGIYKLNSENKLSRFATVVSQESALSFADDGSYLVLTNQEEGSAVKLYSSKKSLKHTFKGYRGGCFVTDNGKQFYALYRDESQNTYVDIADENFNIIQTYDLGWGVYASDFCSPMKQVVAFIANIKGNQNIILINIATKKTALIDNPDNITITSLNTSPNQNYLESDIENQIERGILSFSWTTNGVSDALVRYGQLNVIRTRVSLSVTQRLSYKDINGSVKYPVLENAKLIYIGSFYDNDRICSIDQASLELTQPTELKFKSYKPQSYESLYGEVEIAKRKYQPFKYFFDGTLLPISTETLSDVLKQSVFKAFYKDNYPALGLTYYTMDPSENFNFIGSAGYYTEEKIPFAFAQSTVTMKKISLTGQLQYQFLKPYTATSDFLQFKFDTALRQANERLTIKNTLGSTNIGCQFNYGELGITAYDTASIQYQNLRYTGKGKFDYMGYAVYAGASKNIYLYRSNWNNKIKMSETKYPVSSLAQIQLHMPGFGSVLSHFSLTAGVNASNTKLTAVTAQANVVPLCLEIQNGFKFLGLWFNRFVVDATYQGEYALNSNTKFNVKDIAHTVSAKAYFTVSEAIGMLAKQQESFGVEATWTPGQPLNSIKISVYNTLGLDIPIKNGREADSLTLER